MKAKIKKMLFSVALTVLCSFASKAYVFTNNLPFCSVTITYEVRNNMCNVCSFGSVTILPGSQFTLNNCPGFNGLCVVITGIGGSTPPSNHVSVTNCHIVTAFGQTGFLVGCNSGGTWNVVAGSNTWIIG